MFKKKMEAYWKDSGGHFAIWTALLALPLTLSASLALEHTAIQNDRASVKGALDSAH